MEEFELDIFIFLENVRSNINRYITRGIEWSNKKSLVIGFSETVIYSEKIDHLI